MEDLEVTYALHLQLVGKLLYYFLFVIIERFSLTLTVEALQGKTCQNSLLLERVSQFEPTFQGEGSSLGNIFFGFYKTRHILLSNGRTGRQTDRQMDGRTDGRKCYSQYSGCNARIAARCKNSDRCKRCQLSSVHQNKIVYHTERPPLFAARLP